MGEPRVKAALWVQMAVRLSNSAGRPAVVVRKGDPDAGGVLAVLRGRAGLSVLTQVRTAEGAAAWMRGTGPAAVAETDADAYIGRQIQFDPDLWVVEFEAADLLPPFEAKLL